MKISYQWLKDFLKTEWTSEQTADLLTELGLEVEGIEQFRSIKGNLEGVVVGEVLTCDKHPNADKLSLTTVNIGQDELLQIVCGAPNIAAQQKVMVATVGTTLYDKDGKSFPIKKSKIRGEVSLGMICAEDELGVGTSHDGIIVLPKETPIGKSAADYFDIYNDEIFEIGLTPNRADAMSHYGVARDLKAGLSQKDLQLELITPSVIDFKVDEPTLKVSVEVESSKVSTRYCGVSITGVKVKESPNWLKNRLKSIGINPKNNVVDVTNYVLHELGQPLHVFNADMIKGKKVFVKTLKSGTKFTTLDNIERNLHEEDIMICDANNTPLCIAGVLGGINSGVTEGTTDIFLESAYFNPISVRKTSKRHGINSDASFRFERGIDVNLVKYALKRAALLIQKLAGGKISSEIQEYYPEKIRDFEVVVRYNKINTLIGQEIPKETIKNILASLDIKIKSETNQKLGLQVPSYRVDVKRECDIIEEILRIYGYNNINYSYKLNTSLSFSEFNKQRYTNLISDSLVSIGFNETISNSLTKPSYCNLSKNHLKDSQNAIIINPLSSDLETLRQSLLFSSLENISYNLNRQQYNINIFEWGKTYHKQNDKYQEVEHLVLTSTGNHINNHWQITDRTSDFYYLKGVLSNLFSRLGITNYEETPSDNDLFSESLTFNVNKQTVAEIGLVSSKVLKHFAIKQLVVFADIKIEVLLEQVKSLDLKVKELPKHPSVKRDLALLIDKNISYKDLYDTCYQTERKLLKSINLFDVYEGDSLPEGKKSYALSFVLGDDNKTLNDKIIDKTMNSIQKVLEKRYNIELRA